MTKVKVIATVYGGKKVKFTEEELQEMLENKETYEHADNLPKWMRFYRDEVVYRNFVQVYDAIEAILKYDGVVEIDVSFR